MIVGIDLGTTNSLMAVIEKGRPRLLLSETGSALVPSVIFFAPGRDPVVGDAAKEKKKSAPRQTLYSTKRFMGRGKADIQEWERILPFDFSPSTAQMVGFRIGDKVFTPIDAAALVLKRLKALGESALAKEVKKAVITVPAYFNDAQRQATKVAGEIAGLEVVRIVNEPTAACLAYGLDKKASGIVAVFDLGGGTFDISILRVSEGVFEVLATNGDTALGGDDFDRLLAEHAAVAFEKQGVDPMVSPEDRALMLVEAERVKKALSDSQSAEFSFKHLSTTVTKAEFEALITPLLEKAMAPCQACLTDAGVARVSDVILVGGSTRVPAVRAKVKDFFKREPLCSLNPDEVVAVGAAVQANILSGQMGDMLLLDVIPLSLGIETLGGVVNKIIHRNSTVPVSATEQFSTSIDGQVLVDIHVLQGERELVKDNRSLARFQLRIPPLPAGIPKIEVELTVDANGILSVRAVETRTGLSTQVTVNPTYGLTDEEVEKRLMDSFENAESDFEARFLIDAQVEAESVLRSTKKSLEKGSGLLDPVEKASIDSAITGLELALKGTDRKAIKDGVDALAQTTEGFAQKLLNQALQEALKDKQL